MTDTPNEQDPAVPARVRIAYEVAELLTGQRQIDYGDPYENHINIARLWTARNENRNGHTYTARDVAEMMLLLKVARAEQSPTEDSFKDMVGYALLAADFAERERKAAEVLENEYEGTKDGPENNGKASNIFIHHPSSGLSTEELTRQAITTLNLAGVVNR